MVPVLGAAGSPKALYVFIQKIGKEKEKENSGKRKR
jgi:hypothetical protein